MYEVTLMIMKRKSVIAIAAALTLCASAAGVFGMGAGCVAEAAGSLNIDIHPPKVDVKGPLVAASLTVDGKETDYNDAGTAFSEMWGKHGAVMKLYKDWDIHDRMWVDSRCDGNTLDLNGHVITRHADYQRVDGEIMNISGGAHFTIKDSQPYIKHGDVKGGILTGGTSRSGAGGIHISGGHLTMTGGTIYKNNTNEHGGGIYVEKDGSLTMSNASFNGNETKDARGKTHGGAIYIDGGTVNLSGVLFLNNKSENDGGAIYHNKGTLIARNCVFMNNSSKHEGGAIAIDGENVELYNPTMESNHADGRGGAIWINANKVFLSDGTIQKNSADGYGNGIYVDSQNDINIQGRLKIADNGVDNLSLQNGIFSTAHVYNGGLFPGSKVGVGFVDAPLSSSGYEAIKNISEYELNNYIVADRGQFEFRDARYVFQVFMATAISEYGAALYIVIALELIAAVYIIAAAVRKNKKEEVEA